MSLGEKIKYYLLTKYKTIKRAADAIDITRQQLYPYFNNDVEPGAGFLKKLLKDGCDINWLLSDEEGELHGSKANYNYKFDKEKKKLEDDLSNVRVKIDKIISQLKK